MAKNQTEEPRERDGSTWRLLLKVLVWVLAILANAVVTTVLAMNKILLGGIPTAVLFAITIGVATKVTKIIGEKDEEDAKRWEEDVERRERALKACREAGLPLTSENIDAKLVELEYEDGVRLRPVEKAAPKAKKFDPLSYSAQTAAGEQGQEKK